MFNVASRLKILFGFLVICLALPLNSFAATKGNELSQTASTQTSIKSYHEWKQTKVAEIEGRIKGLKDRLNSSSSRQLSNSKDPNLKIEKTGTEGALSPDLQDLINQESLNLSNTKDLSISDYFVGYLAKQKSLDTAIREVSSRLTAEEVAELMMAFAERFDQSSPRGLKSPTGADSGK